MRDDAACMRRAIRLAAKGAGRTSPNPLVGAVIAKDGAVVAAGWHRAHGAAHAEAEALGKAGAMAKGATLYLTLEPCTTCVDATVAAGIARVVAAVRDPDPRTSGKGLRALKAAPITVEEGLLADEAATVNAGYLTRVRKGRPHVTVKLATTLDGRAGIAGRRHLVGKRAQREVHQLRDRSDAVLVGVDTVLADDPQLTVREVKGRDPLRVVVDADARTPVGARVMRAKDPQRTVIFIARDADPRRANRLRDSSVLVATAPRVADGLDLAAVLAWLAGQGVNTVLAEAGPAIASALVAGGLADRLLVYIAPVAGGGGPQALPDLGQAFALGRPMIRKVGDDVAISGDIG
ncbi:MAG: bifunctional diaminohydroxyphosphoribosylaminopyrimidine deaminase/5-amino-6-(5-phosphoribosylamino)uracil reductase RibD [Chloroflexi bacterium]|nr:bifunctional diaminohydroxyphosphoribosylaminopyrimidine deaminase/5-amino-6-(5-phosphoribosylamino)uracil reductase RibD [Chloroflexota bacterium]